MKKQTKVQKFLKNNPHLLPLLYKINKKSKKYFGKSSRLTLEIVTDTKAPGIYETLVVSIITEFSVDEALKRLNRFDDEWWLNALSLKDFRKIIVDIGWL